MPFNVNLGNNPIYNPKPDTIGPGDPFYINPDAAASDPGRSGQGQRRGIAELGEDPTKLYIDTPYGSFPAGNAADSDVGTQPNAAVTEPRGSWHQDGPSSDELSLADKIRLGTTRAIDGVPGAVEATTRGAGEVVTSAGKGALEGLGPLLAGLGLGGASGIGAGAEGLSTFDAERAQAAEAYRRALGIADQAGAFQGGTIREVDPLTAQQIQARNVAAPALGSAAQAQAQRVANTQIELADANAARDRQLGALGTIEQEAAGTGLGAELANARVRSALERINQQAMGAANQARGAERAGARREAMLQGGQLGLQAALAAEEQALQARLGAQTAALQGAGQVRAGDVELATRQAELNAQRRTLDAQLATAVSQGNAQEVNRLKQAKADLELRAGQGNQAANLQAQQANQTANLTAQAKTQELGLERDVQSAQSQRQDQDLRNTGQTNAVNAGTSATQASTQAGTAANTALTEREKAKALERAGTLGAISAVGSALATSDARAKRDIKPENPEDTGTFLDALRAVSYRYKSDSGDHPLRHGVLAQDLEKSEIGRSTVYTAPDGTKMVDPTALTLALAAAVADQLPRRKAR
jgi:hypothetical protein